MPVEDAEAVPPVYEPRLGQPLQLPPADHEIAPSLQESIAPLPGSGAGEDGRLRGVVIHRLLQVLSEAQRASWPQLLRGIAGEFDLEGDDARLQQWYQECDHLLQNPRLSHIFAAGQEVESLNEVPIIYSHGGRTVHGVIDRLLLRQDEAWLIDYKTHRHADAENCAVLAADYRSQLAYYAHGIQQLWPQRRLRTFLLFTTPGLLHELTVSEPPR